MLSSLQAPVVNLGATTDEGLRKMAWGGACVALRAAVWRLLTEFCPVQAERRTKEMTRKRREYMEFVSLYFDRDRSFSIPQERAILMQLSIDIPRHKNALFHCKRVSDRVERCLFLWALRHPAVGYVQGIDDLMIIFFFVFFIDAILNSTSLSPPSSLQAAITEDVVAFEEVLAKLSDSSLDDVEADSYWCGGRMLSWVQDHFVHGQPGIHRMLHQLDALMRIVDCTVAEALDGLGVRFADCCFQWMHCLLARELKPRLTIRLWDTYLSVGSAFGDLHVYVCAALLLQIRESIVGQPIDVVMAKMKLPKSDEDLSDAPIGWVDELVAMAYMLMLKHPIGSLQHS
jgi:hypothetical protein